MTDTLWGAAPNPDVPFGRSTFLHAQKVAKNAPCDCFTFCLLQSCSVNSKNSLRSDTFEFLTFAFLHRQEPITWGMKKNNPSVSPLGKGRIKSPPYQGGPAPLYRKAFSNGGQGRLSFGMSKSLKAFTIPVNAFAVQDN